MEKGQLDDIYVSVRPYLYDAAVIREFLDENLGLDKARMLEEIRNRAKSAEGAGRTDFQILFNAVESSR